MKDVLLKCGYRLSTGEVDALLAASVDQIAWYEESVAQHPDITDVAQRAISPVTVAGVRLPNPGVAYILSTVVLEGEGTEIHNVQSSADYITKDRDHYSYSERKSIPVDSLAAAKEVVLGEIKRFLRLNLNDPSPGH
jgi:hypothetical protein